MNSAPLPQDERYPDRIGIGDGPQVPCRLVAMDFARDPGAPIVSGVRLPDGTFRFDVSEDAVRLHRDRVQAWLDSMAPALRAFHEQMRPTVLAFTAALRSLAEFIEQHPELRDMQPEPSLQACNHLCGRHPDHECTGDATGTAAYRPGGREVPMCGGCRQATLLAWTSDRDWPAPAGTQTCAHVCGPDPGHVCDARATTTLRHPLPSGGTRELPLCGPCENAERTSVEVAP